MTLSKYPKQDRVTLLTLSKDLEKDQLRFHLAVHQLVGRAARALRVALALRPPALLLLALLLLVRLDRALLLDHAAHGAAQALQGPLHRLASFRHCTITIVSLHSIEAVCKNWICTLSRAVAVVAELVLCDPSARLVAHSLQPWHGRAAVERRAPDLYRAFLQIIRPYQR